MGEAKGDGMSATAVLSSLAPWGTPRSCPIVIPRTVIFPNPAEVDAAVASCRAACPPVGLRAFSKDDEVDVFQLLDILPRLYPGGFSWLERRLFDVVHHRAHCTLAVSGRELVGITIETPKPASRMKLSTLWVKPEWRRRGVGSLLLGNATRRWRREGIRAGHVTCDLAVAPVLSGLLSGFAFDAVSVEWERYGTARHEAVFAWLNP